MNWITPYTLAAEDRPHARAVRTALVRELYRRGRVSVLMQLAFLAIFGLVLRQQMATVAWLWFLFPGLVLMTLLRAVLAFQEEHSEATLRWPSPRFVLFLACSSGYSLFMGGIMVVVVQHLAAGQFLLLTLCMTCLASLGCITMAGSPLCYLVSLLPILGSLGVVGCLRSPLGMGYLFPLVVLVYGCALLATSFHVHREMFRSVLMTHRLEDLALRDPLTGLRNRRYLQEFMQEETPRVLRRWLLNAGEILHRRSISLILVDLDLFKRVNDEYGHAAGDAVLLQVSRLLKDIVRKPDLVLRWGGEEFLILALDSDRTTPPLIAVRVHEQMADFPFLLPGGQTIRQTCSVGYAIFPFLPERPEGLGWEQVFRLADESLYGAKDKGRNRLQGLLAGAGDPDAIIAALSQPDPDFAKALKDGLLQLG